MVRYQIDTSDTKKGGKRALAGWLACLLLTSGCSGWQAVIDDQGLHQHVLATQWFRHRLAWNDAAQARLSATHRAPAIWHVYIEGDGRAVTGSGQPALDPTPRSPLLLPALGADPYPALWLGRPCYFATDDPRCDPTQWTLHRYSDAVVASLAEATTAWLPPTDRIILIGHSGGGTLAMLLAARLPHTCAVITLAGNLDVTRWIEANDFTPLPDSLDPARQPLLPGRIVQWHLAGAEDTVVDPAWTAAASQRQPAAHYLAVPGAGHLQPWQSMLINSLQPNPVASPLQQALDNSQSECGKVTE